MKRKFAALFLSFIIVVSLVPMFSLSVYAMADTYTTISAGENHSLAIKSDGSLWAWGVNEHGQLGDGTTEIRDVPTYIMDDVVMVSAGFWHTLAVTSDGTLWGWGSNMDNTMGTLIDSGEDALTPTRLAGDVVSASAGVFCSSFITTDGRLWLSAPLAWGTPFGEDGREHPQAKDFFYALDDVVDVQVYSRNVYALKSDDSLWFYEGAVGATAIGAEWVKVQDDVASFDMARDEYITIIKTDGSLWSTHEFFGGDGTGELVHATDSVIEVAFSFDGNTVLFVYSDNTAWQWGRVLGAQQGDDLSAFTSEAKQQLDNVVSVSVGNNHAMALTKNGEIYCWGGGYQGQVGAGGFDRSLEPVRIGDGYMLPIGRPSSIGGTSELAPVNLSPPQLPRMGVGITGGSVCAVARPDGILWAWGNSLGEEPTQYLDNVAYVSANSHIMALQTDGTLWGLGLNTYNQIDGSTEKWHREPVKIMDNVAEISAGVNYTLALQTDGTLWGWGNNEKGQLGDGSIQSRSAPVQVLDHVVSVHAGHSISLAIRSDNTLWAWGTGAGLDAQLTPKVVMADVASAKTRLGYVVALTMDGELVGWGDNRNGFMGSDGAFDEPSHLMDGVASFDIGENAVFAVDDGGALWAWGENQSGQLGNGSKNSVSIESPFMVMDGIASVSASLSNTIATKEDGTIWVWGAVPEYGEDTPLLEPMQIEFADGDVAPNSEAPQSRSALAPAEKEGSSLLVPLLIGGAVVVVGIIVAVIVIVRSEKKKKQRQNQNTNQWGNR